MFYKDTKYNKKKSEKSNYFLQENYIILALAFPYDTINSKTKKSF